jgi:hypothetical protein
VVSRLDGAPEGAADGDDEVRFRLGPRLPAAANRSGGDTMADAWDLF